MKICIPSGNTGGKLSAIPLTAGDQGCRMVYFQTKNPIWRALCRMEYVCIFYDHLEYFMAIWYNLWPFGMVCGDMVYFPILVCLDQDKSGNPAGDVRVRGIVSTKSEETENRKILIFFVGNVGNRERCT
jgi:hypothetical protein